MKYFLRCLSIPLACAGLVALAVPIASAQAVSYSEFRARESDYARCATDLVSTGVTETDAVAACAAALAPRDIGECVSDLYDNTELEPAAIVAGCRRVRRPVDLASCVVDIRSATVDATELNILDSCRRSLLPRRYSNCVVGLSQSTEVTGTVALNTCAAAGDRPRNLQPNFVPISEGIPTTPRSNLSSEGANAEDNTPLRFTPLVPTQP